MLIIVEESCFGVSFVIFVVIFSGCVVVNVSGILFVFGVWMVCVFVLKLVGINVSGILFVFGVWMVRVY